MPDCKCGVYLEISEAANSFSRVTSSASRPGSTGADGLHHLIWEVVDNAIDEAMAGYARNITVEFLPGIEVAVSDDGRGIPVDIHKQTKKSALETVMTTLHAGGKFGGESFASAICRRRMRCRSSTCS